MPRNHPRRQLAGLVTVRTLGELGTSAMLPFIVIWAHRDAGLGGAAAGVLFIVQAAGESDVIAAVRLAAQEGLQVKARAGGHSWTGSAVRAGGLIDLSGMTEVSYNPSTGIAAVQPGVTGRELNGLLAEVVGRWEHLGAIGLLGSQRLLGDERLLRHRWPVRAERLLGGE